MPDRRRLLRNGGDLSATVAICRRTYTYQTLLLPDFVTCGHDSVEKCQRYTCSNLAEAKYRHRVRWPCFRITKMYATGCFVSLKNTSLADLV